jgi:hypothetical protein
VNCLTPLLLLAAVLSAGDKGRVESGDWGGRGARLTVDEDGARLELDCAHGSLEAMTLGEEGRFDVAGRFVREHGGPIRKDEAENAVSARYRGSVQGHTMTLEIVLEDEGGQTVGPFELTLGGQGRLMKCR